jgi:hypothetical protein
MYYSLRTIVYKYYDYSKFRIILKFPSQFIGHTKSLWIKSFMDKVSIIIIQIILSEDK